MTEQAPSPTLGDVGEIEALRAKVAAYEAPGGWRVLYARDARRVLGDPTKGVGMATAPWPHNLCGIYGSEPPQ